MGLDSRVVGILHGIEGWRWKDKEGLVGKKRDIHGIGRSLRSERLHRLVIDGAQ